MAARASAPVGSASVTASLETAAALRFLIRTHGKAYLSRPHPLLAATSLVVVAAAVAIPLTPLGKWFGFVVPPVALLITIAMLTAAYLIVVEFVKRWFFERH